MNETLNNDLRGIDEIVCKTGQALQILERGGKPVITLRMIRRLAVAVLHLIQAELKREGQN